MANYVVAAIHPWNREVFNQRIAPLPGEWTFIGNPDELDLDRIGPLDPRYIFFLHWSWIVPSEIVSRYECINFHLTDLPYGRGGSPLQNLILRGNSETKLSAFRMTDELDAGPVYMKRNLSLDGKAEDIYRRASGLAAEMIAELIGDPVEPMEQVGEPTVFKRRRPEESEISRVAGLDGLYDFIRMLDAEGYPRAFIERDGFRWTFSEASLEGSSLVARVEVTTSGDAK